ncbi:hypothetical protein HK405_006211 [Cladochytrium tenue]|nr:hypothetical protein HK405_006211 [Cladochytrium tenue]
MPSWYSHDLSNVPCRHFAGGYCRDGAACRFRHTTPDTIATESAPAATTTATRPVSSAEPPATNFPPLAKLPQPRLDFWGPTERFSDVARRPAPASAAPATRTSPRAPATVPTAASARPVVVDDLRWVTTGAVAASEYSAARRGATVAAVDRNKLFQRATEAYLSGNHAAARAFSQAAREANDAMLALHADAAADILARRNPSSSSSTSSLATSTTAAGRDLLDLHGLHPGEAPEAAAVREEKTEAAAAVREEAKEDSRASWGDGDGECGRAAAAPGAGDAWRGGDGGGAVDETGMSL